MTIFKCKCGDNIIDCKNSSFMFSNHPIKLHHNMKNWEQPPGLNREYWEVTNYDLWMKTDMEEGIKHVCDRISRNSKYKIK